MQIHKWHIHLHLNINNNNIAAAFSPYHQGSTHIDQIKAIAALSMLSAELTVVNTPLLALDKILSNQTL